LIEYDPAYCDTIIKRWQNYTGKSACLTDSGQTFENVALQRTPEQVDNPADNSPDNLSIREAS